MLGALRTKEVREETMSALELQLTVNAVTGLSPMDGSQSDEHLLVAKAKSGHQEAFGELYKRHQPRTYRAALRILRNQQDAEDAVQRAFQRALVNLQRFREDSAFSTWLTRIVINEALMLLRQRRPGEPCARSRSDEEQRDGTAVIADKCATPEELLCEHERRMALLQAIGRLRENLRTVVLHRELKGLTNAETAQLLGLSVSAVKARVFHAKRFLRKSLERKFERGYWLSRETRNGP
jgi:RNA polymerase sigma-70 factor, ECF subfamily